MFNPGDIIRSSNHKNWLLLDQIDSDGQGNIWIAKSHPEIQPQRVMLKGGQIPSKEIVYPVNISELPAIELSQDDALYAVKILKNPTDKANSRFKLEVLAESAFSDPRIINILDYYEPQLVHEKDPPWLVMEFVGGGNLQEHGVDGTWQYQLEESLKIFKEIVEAVHILHSNEPPVIHRDLKPANIILREDGSPVLTDFGICYVIDDERHHVTEFGEEVGTRGYIAPELRGTKQQKPTQKSDLYSLGKILYFMLSGGHVMDDEGFTDEKWNLKIEGASSQVEYIHKYIFKHTINKIPEGRYDSCEDLLGAIYFVQELLYEHFYPKEKGRRCVVCGEGEYVLPGIRVGLSRLGLAQPAEEGSVDSYWPHFYICDTCGNMQLFTTKIPSKNEEQDA